MKNKMLECFTDQPLLRWLISGIAGLFAYIQPTHVFLYVCFFAVVIDCYFAWDLARRLVSKYRLPKDVGKFTSKKSGKVFFYTLPKIYGLILLMYFMDKVLVPFQDLYLANFTAFAFCGWSAWSALENWSSENQNGFAKFLQRIMINKAERATGMPISDYLKNMKEEKKDE